MHGDTARIEISTLMHYFNLMSDVAACSLRIASVQFHFVSVFWGTWEVATKESDNEVGPGVREGALGLKPAAVPQDRRWDLAVSILEAGSNRSVP